MRAVFGDGDLLLPCFLAQQSKDYSPMSDYPNMKWVQGRPVFSGPGFRVGQWLLVQGLGFGAGL